MEKIEKNCKFPKAKMQNSNKQKETKNNVFFAKK